MDSTNSPIIISGAHSSIGQLLIQSLINRSLSIIGIVSPWGKTDNLITDNKFIDYVHCDLNEPLSSDFKIKCENSTFFIHLAWARPKNSFEAKRMNEKMFNNLKGSLPENIKIIFISSVAATKKSVSNYGKAKYNLCQILRYYESIEVITGLVVSKPAIGPYKVLRDFLVAHSFRFTFLPTPLCFLSSIEQVISGITNAILDFETNKPVVKTFDPEPIALNSLIKDIKKENNSYSLSLLIPTDIVIKILLLLRKLFYGIPIFDQLITLLTISNKGTLEREKN